MNHHERESFIFTIRSGKVYISDNVYVKPPTIDQLAESYIKYQETYHQCLLDEIMTEEDMTIWMKENLIWTKYQETLVDKYKKEVEDFKVEIFENRANPKKCVVIRDKLRAKEKLLEDLLILKNSEYQNTCEGISASHRVGWLISQTTYCGKFQYDFKKMPIEKVVYEWQKSILSEGIIRELARNEPWRSTWAISKNIKTKLFLNKKKQDLTPNQKNIIVWSQIYDNTHESMDCPENSVFEDDDMFDGWMIAQNRKNEKQRLEQKAQEISKNENIKNAQEVLVIANDPEHIKNIHDLNNEHAKRVIASRFNTIREKGSVNQQELPDVKEQLHIQQMQLQKDHFNKG